MKTDARTVNFSLIGSGEITIKWGDGTTETKEILNGSSTSIDRVEL